MSELNIRGKAITGWLRLPPSKVAGPKLQALFIRIASDPRFLRVAELNEAQAVSFRSQLDAATFCDGSILQGGYAGRPPARGLVLGLSWLHRRVVPAAHELFHLARDIRGAKRLDDETSVWREESIVWFLTWQYAPLWTVLELMGHFGILMSGVYAVLQVLYWLLGLGSVFNYVRQLFD